MARCSQTSLQGDTIESRECASSSVRFFDYWKAALWVGLERSGESEAGWETSRSRHGVCANGARKPGGTHFARACSWRCFMYYGYGLGGMILLIVIILLLTGRL